MSTMVASRIELDEQGRAWIQGTKVKVIELAIDKIAHGSSPEELHFQYPHLSLAQIHAALSFYYEHQAEFDAEISRQFEIVEFLAQQSPNSPLSTKLRSLKKKI